MQPDFSIIVPTHNRAAQLIDCATALARLDYPCEKFEVIIVDDGSAASPDAIVLPFQSRVSIRMLHQANAGPGAARNKGASHARGRILAFTDDDCIPAPDWLQKLALRYASAHDPVMIGGQVVNLLVGNRYAIASQLIVDVGHAYHNGDPERARFFTANNLAVPSDSFRQIGGFDATFGTTASEDRELCGRWLHRGYRMIYASEAVVGHAHASTWRSFGRQHFNYGRGAVRLQRARRRQKWDLFAPDPDYYRKLLKAPFSRFAFLEAIIVTGLVVSSQSISAVGMLLEWIRQPSSASSHL